MNRLTLATFAACTACTLLTAQLPSGRYLAGTQGWDKNGKPLAALNTVQLIDPFSGKAEIMKIANLPQAEIPATFLIESPVSFLVGTKTATAPAAGRIYRVRHIGGAWVASAFTGKLAINCSAMVTDGPYAYVIGSAVFAPTARDAQILRIARADGAVTTVAKFGAQFRAGGANGVGTSLALIGTTLHAFTFDSRAPAQPNEHWAISTDGKSVKKIGSLPASKRDANRGFATSSALKDPRSGNLILVGRWGELLWRTPAGKNVSHEIWPGKLTFNFTKMWRSATVNTDTLALAFGDHDIAVDERRCNGASPKDPFINNVVKGIQPTAGIMTIASLAYIPRFARYIPIADGCRGSDQAVPCSYVSSLPSSGNQNFAFTLSTSSKVVALMLGAKAKIDLAPFGAPGCVANVMPSVVLPVLTTTSKVRVPMPLPKGLRLDTHTQWFALDTKANRMGVVVSDARRCEVR